MKTKIRAAILIIATLAVTGLTGCTALDMRILKNQQLFGKCSPADQIAIRQGDIAIGFTPDMVKVALGEPDQISHLTDKGGPYDLWHYPLVPETTTLSGGYYATFKLGSYYMDYGGRIRFSPGYWSQESYPDQTIYNQQRSHVIFRNGHVTNFY